MFGIGGALHRIDLEFLFDAGNPFHVKSVKCSSGNAYNFTRVAECETSRGFYGVPSGCVSDQYLLFNVGEFFNMNLKKGNFFKIILIFANIENIN